RCLVSIAACLCLVWTGCGDDDVARSSGDSCAESQECQSNLCYGALCVDPADDDDGDGLTNEIEAQLGTNAQSADTDGDGRSDLAEVGNNIDDPPDEDGDETIDALESALVLSTVEGYSETDDDCLAPQKDPDDETQNTDEDWVADLSCCCYGTCEAAEVTVTGYTCTSGEPVCSFGPEDDLDADGQLAACDDDDDGDGVADENDCAPTDDAASPLAVERCDGVDNDCDDKIDEHWPNLGEVCLDVDEGCGGRAVYECPAKTTDPEAVCPSERAPLGTACDDERDDTHGDRCDAEGRCVGLECPDGGACTDISVSNDACVYTPQAATCFIDGACYEAGDARPGSPCERCDPEAASDGWTPLPDGTVCDDGDACTSGDLCVGLECVAQPTVCVDEHLCTLDGCAPTTGCVYTPNDTACDDDTDCTVDSCDVEQGCVFTPDDSVCAQGDPCWLDSCAPDAGGCVRAWVEDEACAYDCAVSLANSVFYEAWVTWYSDGSAGLAVANGFAYLINQAEELIIIDVSDPQVPQLVLSQPEGPDGTPTESTNFPGVNLPYSVVLSPDGVHAFISNSSSTKGIVVVDITDPSHPFEVGNSGTIDSPPLYGLDYDDTKQVVYAASWDDGLVSVDVSVLATPVEMQALPIEGNAYDVEVVGDLAFVATSDAALVIVDVTAPDEMFVLSTVPGIDGSESNLGGHVDVDGHLALTGGYYGGFQLIDISDPTTPVVRHVEDEGGSGSVIDVVLEGAYAYVVDGNWLRVYDITSPGAPVSLVETQIVPSGDFRAMVLSEGRLFVSGTSALLTIHDLVLPCTEGGGDPCLLDTCDIQTACSHDLPVVCDDFDDLCTLDSCVPGVGCVFEPIPDCLAGQN
ncbi:MAG: hypothetical protein QF464_01615, partial [Myxococcota bacterium]|nr:hypothetical protein [Myxococcota bacterium]